MGIPKFFKSFLKDRDATVLDNKCISEKPPATVTSLSFDLNSIIHQAAGKIYHYAYANGYKKEQIENKRKEELISKIPNVPLEAFKDKSLVEVFNMYIIENKIDPNTLEQELFSAITKKIIVETRKLKPEYLIIAVDGLAPMAKIAQQRKRRYRKKPSDGFDNNCITPGTGFMQRLDSHLKTFLRRAKPAKRIIYSGYKVEGEGEHKIFDLFREKKIPTEGNHIVVALDADLIIIGLISMIPNIWILRTNDFGPSEFIDISVIRKWTEDTFNITPNDFAIITSLIGNDFVPKCPHFYDVKSSMYALLYAYKKTGKPLSVNKKVDFTALQEILEIVETLDLSEIGDFSGTLLSSSINGEYIEPEPTFEFLKEKGITTETLEIFDDMWNAKSILPSPDEDYFEMILGMGYSKFDMYAEQQAMAKQFIEGIAWCNNYYHSYPIDKFWFYRYAYSPTLNSIIDYLSKLKSYPKIDSRSVSSGVLTFREQLLCVIPPASFNLLPPEYLKLVAGGPLECMTPRNVKISLQGVHDKNEAIVVVPPPDIEFMFLVTGGEAVNEYIGTNLYLDNKEYGIRGIQIANKNILGLLDISKYEDYIPSVEEMKIDVSKDNEESESESESEEQVIAEETPDFRDLSEIREFSNFETPQKKKKEEPVVDTTKEIDYEVIKNYFSGFKFKL